MAYTYQFKEKFYQRLREALDRELVTVDEFLRNIFYRMSYDHTEGIREELTEVRGYIPDQYLSSFVQAVESEEPRVPRPHPTDPIIYAECLQAEIDAKAYILEEARNWITD